MPDKHRYFFSTLLFFLLAFSAHAQTSRIEELQQSISSRETEIKQLEEEIADYKNRIDNVGSQKRTLQSALSAVDLTRAKLAKDVQLSQKKIEQTNATITGLSNDITAKENRIENNKKIISRIIYEVDQSDHDTILEVFLSHASISEFLENVDNLAKLQLAIQDNIKTLERLKTELGTTKTNFQSERKKLTKLSEQLSDQKEIADQERRRQSLLLSSTKNQESNYKKLLAEREARKQQFEREVDDFEAQLKAEIDPSSFPPPGTKVFSFPVAGGFVTQKFGKTVDARRLYVSGTHNGTDFRASPGSIVMSAGGGEVVATGDTDKVCPGASYGRWVLVRHRNGLSTLYAHLELIKARVGQMVDTGDTLGYSGNTGYSTGPHLHFTVYVSSAVDVVDFPSKSCKGAIFRMPVAAANGYLDPQDYL